MMTMKGLVLAVLAFTVPALSSRSLSVKERLRTPPTPVTGFDMSNLNGKWFFRLHLPSCSWSSSENFTDYSKEFELQGDTLLNHETMRNYGLCSSVTSVWYSNGSGKFKGVDTVGDNWTGDIYVIAADNDFYISWGCTKWTVLRDRCLDPGIYVLTRKVDQYPPIIRPIDDVLRNTFGIFRNELTEVRHEKDCSSEA